MLENDNLKYRQMYFDMDGDSSSIDAYRTFPVEEMKDKIRFLEEKEETTCSLMEWKKDFQSNKKDYLSYVQMHFVQKDRGACK